MPNLETAMEPPRILLDASVLKHAVDRRIVGREEHRVVDWGGVPTDARVTVWAEAYPRPPRTLLPHLGLIPLIAHLGRRGRIELMVHAEVLSEFWGLPDTRDPRGMLLGAPVSRAPNPIRYSRVVVGGLRSPKQLRQGFLESLTHPRFLELQRVTGANNPGPKRVNQLADAFHIWTAEEANAYAFLTTDLTLVQSAQHNRPEKPKVPVLSPRALAGHLLRDRILRLGDAASWVSFRLRTKGRAPELHPHEQLLDLSRRQTR